jgi:hypothetical protein
LLLSSLFYTAQFWYKKENIMSKFTRSFIFVVLTSILLGACSAQPAATTAPAANPYAPQPGDEVMMRGDPEIVSATVLTAESLPSQVSVSLAYRLPSPCYELRVSVSQPDNQNQIDLLIYGVTPKKKPCNLMALLTPMEANISLGSFPAGQYTVSVNGQQVGDFDAR